jgi:hypothetical protein
MIQGDFDASIGGGAGDRSKQDGFVAAFDHNGNVVWLHRWTSLGAVPLASTFADGVAINGAGVWVLGVGETGIDDLGGGTVSLPQNAQQPTGPFIAHYTASGAFVSAAPLALPALCQTSQCESTWMAFDASGHAYWLIGAGLLNKSDTEGNLLWSEPLPKGSSPAGVAVSDSGEVAVSAGYALVMLAPDGSQRWSRRFDGGAPRPAAFDRTGAVIVGGTFAGAIDLGGPAPLQSPAHDSQAPTDNQAQPMFLAKYDASGKYLWSHAYGSTPRAQSTVDAIHFAPNQDVIFTGAFAGAVDFGTGAYQASPNSQNVDWHDVFLARLAPDGAGRWSAAIAGGNALGDYGACLSAALDGRVAMGGWFDRTIDFGNGPFTASGVYGSQWGPAGDGYVAVFAP